MLQIPPAKLKEILIKDALITAENFDAFSKEASRMSQDLVELLVSRGIMTRDYFYNILAQYLGVERADLTTRLINEEVLKRLPADLARQKRAVIFNQEKDGALDAAMEDPNDLGAIEFLERYLKARIKPFLATKDDLDKGFAVYSRQLVEDFRKAILESIQASLQTKAEGLEEAASQAPIVAILDNFLFYAIASRASDIHLEILEDGILTRFRIDGVLHEVIRMPKEIHPALTARIKLLGGLKLDEHLKPQDGRFRYKAAAELIDVRVAAMPTIFGEKTELRLLPATQKPLSLEELGMLEDIRKIAEENIKKTYGMILVCGPTGCGKTTTLYSILNMLNKPEVNVITIEDPIEYNIKYINQTQVNPQAGISFANGLRAILRQDPNIIMVGEIRDEETAEIAVHAALTGHLVLSSLHTNDAATAVPRLIDMKIPAFLVSAVLNVVIAQRLVRKICLKCVESFIPPAELMASLKRQLEELGLADHFRTPKALYRGRGCAVCGNSGYFGRLGIFEALNIDEEIRKLIISADFSLDGLKELAKKKGMLTMFEDGLRKAELGMTTIEEVLRVIRE
jgi:type II secretory ATPase GspE/PulE/Tfp pilus assembly ATPase PilB-like protein